MALNSQIFAKLTSYSVSAFIHEFHVMSCTYGFARLTKVLILILYLTFCTLTVLKC